MAVSGAALPGPATGGGYITPAALLQPGSVPAAALRTGEAPPRA